VMSTAVDREQQLAMARDLVAQLEAENDEQANLILHQMVDIKDSELFIEIGRLTRNLHEAINGFLLDTRIAELAEREIPDASERLNYVITMTEQSANTSLDAVEMSLPLADELGSKAQELSSEWQRFQARDLSIEQFRQLSRNLDDFLRLTEGYAKQLHSCLSDILLAQDFQDLTSQIIRQVISLIHDVETNLVHLVRISGGARITEKQESNKEKLEGPVIPTIDQGNVVSSQDDVDDLLSSLGF